MGNGPTTWDWCFRGQSRQAWQAFPNGFPAIFHSFALDAYPRPSLSAHFSRRLQDDAGSANLLQAEPGTETESWGAKAAKPCKTLISVRGFLRAFHKTFGVIFDICLSPERSPQCEAKKGPMERGAAAEMARFLTSALTCPTLSTSEVTSVQQDWSADAMFVGIPFYTLPKFPKTRQETRV